MQSGEARTKEWVLEHDLSGRRDIEPLMGWTSTTDTQQQVRLSFETKEDAIAYAQRQGLQYTVIEPTLRKPLRKAYADNFKYGRKGNWTH